MYAIRRIPVNRIIVQWQGGRLTPRVLAVRETIRFPRPPGNQSRRFPRLRRVPLRYGGSGWFPLQPA